MSRPKTPTKLLELNGAFKKNPNRSRDSEPEPTGGIGPAPERLTEKESAAWDEVVRFVAPGVLTNMDRLSLEIVAMNLAEVWDRGTTQIDRDRILKQLGKFGMNPSDRAGVCVPKKPKGGRFSNLED